MSFLMRVRKPVMLFGFRVVGCLLAALFIVAGISVVALLVLLSPGIIAVMCVVAVIEGAVGLVREVKKSPAPNPDESVLASCENQL